MGFEVRVIGSLFYVVFPLWALLGMRTCLECQSDGVYGGVWVDFDFLAWLID